MARKLKITSSVLNVRLHPHPEGIYDKWLTAIYRAKIIAPIHGDRHGIISLLDRRNADSGILDGIITTFLKLDSRNWFNADELDSATVEQISEIKIPKNLYPNSSSFYFRFDTASHRLYVQSYSDGKTLTPTSAHRFFASLARNLKISSKFNEATITLVQSKVSVDKMFNIAIIKRVTVILQRPNSDIFDDNFEDHIEEHLKKTSSQRVEITYRAQPGESITRDDDLNRLTDAAVTNGTVSVTGRDERGAVNLRSDKFPEVLHDKFDPDEQTEQSAFHRLIPPRRNRQ